jgi:hypothetical protein
MEITYQDSIATEWKVDISPSSLDYMRTLDDATLENDLIEGEDWEFVWDREDNWMFVYVPIEGSTIEDAVSFLAGKSINIS